MGMISHVHGPVLKPVLHAQNLVQEKIYEGLGKAHFTQADQCQACR